MTRRIRTILAAALLASASCAHAPPRNDEVTASMTEADARALEGQPRTPSPRRAGAPASPARGKP